MAGSSIGQNNTNEDSRNNLLYPYVSWVQEVGSKSEMKGGESARISARMPLLSIYWGHLTYSPAEWVCENSPNGYQTA